MVSRLLKCSWLEDAEWQKLTCFLFQLEITKILNQRFYLTNWKMLSNKNLTLRFRFWHRTIICSLQPGFSPARVINWRIVRDGDISNGPTRQTKCPLHPAATTTAKFCLSLRGHLLRSEKVFLFNYRLLFPSIIFLYYKSPCPSKNDPPPQQQVISYQ